MTPAACYFWTGLALVAIGLWGATSPGGWMRRIIAVNVMGSGVFLTLVATSWRPWPATLDPVPQALVLTGIVVAVSATALALALVRRIGAAEKQAQREQEKDPQDISNPTKRR